MTITELKINSRDLDRGLALARTPQGEVVVHIRDARLPIRIEGEKLPILSRNRLFLHSWFHLPEIGDTVIATVRQGQNDLYAHWCPQQVWENATQRFQVVFVNKDEEEHTIWQGNGVLELSLLFGSEMWEDYSGVIFETNDGHYVLDLLDADGELKVPAHDPRLEHSMLPHGHLGNFVPYFQNLTPRSV